MNELKAQDCKKELYKIYGRLGLSSRIYTYLRVFTAPLLQIEKYVPKSGTILDIGCGSGIFSNILCMMSQQRSAIGIDISIKRIEHARSTIINGRQLSFHVQDAQNLVLNGFSIVTVVDLLHHITFQEQERLLKKIYSGLETPGLLVLKDLEKKPFWKYIFHYLQDSISYRSKLFFRGSDEMEDLLNDIGFKVRTIPLKSSLPYPHILYLCEKCE